MAKIGNFVHQAGRVSAIDSPKSANAPIVRSLPSRSLPIAPGKQAGFITFLLIADVAALTAAGMLSLSHHPTPAWAITLAVISAVICLQTAGFSIGMYNVANTARLSRACLAAIGLGLASTALAAFVAYALGGTAVLPRPLFLGGVAILELMLVRLVLIIAAERCAAAVAERVILVGTPLAVAAMLTSEQPPVAGVQTATVDPASTARLAGWVRVTCDEVMPLPRPFGLPVRDVGLPLGELSPAICEPTMLADEALLAGYMLLSAGRVDRVVIASAGLPEPAIEGIVSRLEHLSLEISLAPWAAIKGDRLDRNNCVVLRHAAISPAGLIIKRAVDLVGGIALFIFTLPVAIVAAILIRQSSPGPVLFRQTRWGLNNLPFTVYKFRTMWVNAPATDGSVQATRNDPRITPIGALLRRTSLDELPQLLNVLNGTMSLVGPRPHPAELNRRCVGQTANYLARHRVAPGITGLAQIKGFRGETRTSDAMQKRVDLDVEYIERRSAASDVLILLKTFVSVIRADAY